MLQGRSAAVAFHLYLMAQPPGLPEKIITGSSEAFFGHFLDAWSAVLGYDAAAVWKAWAPELHHRTTGSGHFMAEQDPDGVVRAIRDLLAR